MKEIVDRDEKTTREVWKRNDAIEHFKNGLVKILAHDTNIAVPIMNSLYMNGKSFVPFVFFTCPINFESISY